MNLTVGKNITKVSALQLSLVAIATVVIFEGVAGILTNSLAIISDAAHALFDTLTSIILLVTTQLSLKPPDEEHLYGHGKIEPIGGFVGGIALMVLAGFLFYEAITRIAAPGQVVVRPEIIGFGAIGYTLAVDFFRIGILWGRDRSSVTLKAGLYDAFSDFASTVIALLGFGITYIGGDARVDATASIVLAFLLVYLTIRLIRSSGAELSDQISKNVVVEVRREILKTPGVSLCKELKVRRVGSKTFVETTVCVPSSMGLTEAHSVASQIEANINRLYGDSSVTVHIEPVGKEKPVEREIERLAMVVEGVKGVHDLNTVYSRGRLYITLHALVDPQLPIEKAHSIAEKIEDNLRGQISSLENVTVHIEPYEAKANRELALEDAEVRRMIRQIIAAHPDIKSVKRVVIYVSEKRRYINIDCLFDKDTSVQSMHDTVSHVENEIKGEFKEAIVTIHAEPLP